VQTGFALANISIVLQPIIYNEGTSTQGASIKHITHLQTGRVSIGARDGGLIPLTTSFINTTLPVLKCVTVSIVLLL
jgi:hypothetical protein